MPVDPIEIHPRPIPSPPPPSWGPHEDLFDWQKISRYVRFSLGSVRRRPWLFLLISGGMVLLAAGALAVLPKTYEVQARLLVQKNPVLAVRADANAESPTRAAAEIIVRRDNLHALIQQTDLIKEWRTRRSPLQRAKDWLLLKFRPPPTDGELLDALTGLLQKQLMVWVTNDSTVTIRLQWPDGVMAYRLVDAAHRNFFETRHVLEISTMAEQISILEGHSAKLKAEVDKNMAELQRLREHSPTSGRNAPRPMAMTPPTPDTEVVNLRVMLEAKRRAIADLDEFRRRHLVEQQTRLTELRALYSESHPLVADLQQSVGALQNDSPQMRTLREEEASLRRELAKHSGLEEAPARGSPVIPQELFRQDYGNEDPAVDYARAQLRFAAMQYAAMRERIDAAGVDLDTARAAFKYRYSVVLPPEMPRGPITPKAPLVMIAALISGLLLALFGTTAADLRGGAVLERWQLDELLGSWRSVAIIEVRSP